MLFNKTDILHNKVPSVPSDKNSIETKNKKIQDIRIRSSCIRIMHSTLFWSSACLLLITFTATRLYGNKAASIGLLFIGFIKSKKLKYELSIIPTALKRSENKLGDEIIPGKLILGPIPLKNKMDHKRILDMGVTLVLTMLEQFEWESLSLFSEPMTPHDWTILSVNQKVIETPDFEPVSLDDDKAAVEAIREEILKGGCVYGHCKAGKGRSATVVICYLLKYGHEHGINVNSVDEAIAYVKSKREVININSSQYKGIVNFYNDLCLRWLSGNDSETA